ncbi:MAG: PHB depolymerase family esterase [Gammaproteobacteria bacterium]|nr:PHB depolymerase family esterase [Gammaproteobacteria bacterium]
MPTSPNTRTGAGKLERGARLARFRGVVGALVIATGVPMHTKVAAGAPVEVSGFGSNPGNLRMWWYRPDGLSAGAPLVVAIHGCRQSASAFDDETGWVQLADRFGFALLLPEQKKNMWLGNNPLGCFNWFYRGDQVRGRGEALSIKQMVDTAIADHAIDPERVYVTGLSAGGAMTAVMLAVYPEMFAGGAVIAGIPYQCAEVPNYVPLVSISYLSVWLGFTDPFVCMDPGVDRAPEYWAERVRAATAFTPKRWPVLSIWQGTADATVHPRNANELVEQWTNVQGTDAIADAEETINGHTRREYQNAAGEPVVELYLIAAMDHGVPINPAPLGASRTAAEQCGRPADYVLPVGICAAYHIARFWGLTGP